VSSIKQKDGTESTLGPCYTKSINEIVGESEGDTLRCFQCFPLHRVKGCRVSRNKRAHLLEKTVEINVDDIPIVRIHKYVFEMTIAETITRADKTSFGKYNYLTQG
jgi:hypothetical protein